MEVLDVIKKVVEDVKKNLIVVLIVGIIIFYEVCGYFGVGNILIMFVVEGIGVIVGGFVRVVFELVGLKDVRVKFLGFNNLRNMVNVIIEGFNFLKIVEDIVKFRGKKVEEFLG